MSDFAADLKARADLAAIVGEAVALKKTSNGWIGLCPFHSEKTASFHVHAARQFYYCFGCQAHGDVYAFLMQTQKLGFREAVEALAEKLNVPLPPLWGQGSESGDDGRRAELLRIHAAAAQFFASQLRAPLGAAARAYLEGRGVLAAAIERFGLGFAPGSGRALTEWLRQRSFAPELALSAGLCQPRRASTENDTNAAAARRSDWDDLYDRFRDRVIFPIADERGRPIAFGGRLLAADPARPAPKYLNSPETPIYTKGRVLYNLDRAREVIRRLGYFILVEGYFDCLAVFMAGFENVVASCGTALSAAQIATLGRYAKNVVVNFDPDAAGAGAAEKSIALLLEEGCKVRVVSLPSGLDPDQFLRQQGAEAYGKALKQSAAFFSFLGERARQRFDLRRAEGRVAALNFLLPYVNRVHDAMLRSELTDELAMQLGIENAVERQQLRKATQQRRSNLSSPAETAGGDLLPAERVLLRAIVEWDHERERLLQLAADENLLQGLATEPWISPLRQLPELAHADWNDMQSALEPADRRLLATVLLHATEPLDEATVAGAIEALRDRPLERRRRQLQAQVKDAEWRRDHLNLKGLLTELQEVERRLRERRQAFQLRRDASA